MLWKSVSLILLLLCGFTIIAQTQSENLQVYIVPHSHWDVGWKLTIDGYYERYVRSIVNNVLELLRKNPTRRFVFSEIAYIERWWKEASQEKRDLFTSLLQAKQIEFVLGGRTMPDEAVNTYSSLINTMSLGLQWIKETFGEKYIPRTAWRIDPFGSSTASSKLYHDMGFTSAVIYRIPHGIENELKSSGRFEFLYQLKGGSSLLTTVMNYCIWDFFKDESFRTNDVKDRAQMVLDEINFRLPGFSNGRVLIPLGCDFSWVPSDNRMYEAVEETIEYMNKRKSEYKMNIRLSLVSDYFKALNPGGSPLAGITKYNGDLLPYSDADESYWTGYYSSRPQLKKEIREAEYTMRLVNSFYSLAYIESRSNSVSRNLLLRSHGYVVKLNNAVADVTHHDAVTGTSASEVVEDYRSILKVATAEALSSPLAFALQSLISLPVIPIVQSFQIIPSDNKLYAMIISNSLSWSRTGEIVRVQHQHVKDMLCIYSPEKKLIESYEDSNSVVYFAANVPALGFSTYYAKKCPKYEKASTSKAQESKVDYMENDFLKVHFCKNNHRLSLCKISNLKTSESIDIRQGMFEYTGRSKNEQNAGAYIFAPDFDATPEAVPLPEETGKINKNSSLVQEFTQTAGYTTQRIILYKDADYIEIETTVGPIPVGKELVTRFTTSIKNEKVIYVDKNGLEMRRWKYQTDTLPSMQIAKNILPMVQSSYIEDGKNRLSIISTQAYGISSQQTGSVEILLHRSCIADDNKGLDANMEDTSIYTSRIRLKLESSGPRSPPIIHNQKLIAETNNPLHISLFGSVISMTEYSERYRESYSALKPGVIPPDVQILSLETVFNRDKKEPQDTKLVVRLQHLGETEEDRNVNIEELLSKAQLPSLQETCLSTQDVLRTLNIEDSRSITMFPNQIRTFVLQENEKSSNKRSGFFILLVAISLLVWIVAVGGFLKLKMQRGNRSTATYLPVHTEDQELTFTDNTI